MPYFCQKCRQLVRPDTTIEDLNPAAVEVLVASTGRSQQQDTGASRLNYPRERKDLYDRVSGQHKLAIHKRHIPPPPDDGAPSTSRHPPSVPGLGGGNPHMSFVEITQSQVALPERDAGRPTRASPARNGEQAPCDDDNDEDHNNEEDSLASQTLRMRYLFFVLSSRSDVDHPLCGECTSLLLASLSTRLQGTSRERDAYAGFLKSVQQTVKSAAVSGRAKSSRGKSGLPEGTRDATAAYKQLMDAEAESQAVEGEVGLLDEQLRRVHDQEEDYWRSRNALDDSLHDITVRLSSLQEKFLSERQRLERLQRTNVYNDTFCIGHDGYFGTINGLRLGRLPNQNVDWAEINAAWGQTLLLLATVAERLRFTFRGYRLRPRGNTSRIEKLEYPQVSPETSRQAAEGDGPDRGLNSPAANPEPKITPLELFSSGDMAIGRILNHRRFDGGMVAFLDCLAQIGQYVERTSSGDHATRATPHRNSTARAPATTRILPYTIQGDKIGDVSIKLGVGFHQDENFTKACKYALTCCKFLLAHVSNLEVQKTV